MKKYIFHIVFLFILGAELQAQLAPSFNGALVNVLNMNPAAAGSHDAISLSTWYRRQWTGFKDGPASWHVSGHAPLANKNIALGGEIGLDELGPIQNIYLRGSYAYRLINNWGTLSLGVNGGGINNRIDFIGLDAANGLDPAFMAGENSYWDWEAGAGAFFYDRQWMVGAAINDIADLRQWYGSAAWLKTINSSLKIQPSVLGRGASNFNSQVDLGFHFYFLDAFKVGGKWRTNNAWILDAEYRFNTETTYGFAELAIGYGYENAPPEIRTVSSGSHEVYILYRFNKDKSKVLNPRHF